MSQIDDLASMAAKITPVLEKYGAEYAGVFGSYARGQARPDSDVDILVRFNPQRRPRGLIAYVRMIYDIEATLHKTVDLVEDKALNRHIRPQVIRELRTIYGQG